MRRTLGSCAPSSRTDLAAAALARHWRSNAAPAIVLARALHTHRAHAALPGDACVVNLLDEKLFNPNPDHLSYTLSKAALHAGVPLQLAPETLAALRAVLRDGGVDPALKELLLTPPSEATVAERVTPADPARIHALHEQALDQLALQLHDDWLWALEAHAVREGYRPEPGQAGRRALANLALAMLVRHAGRTGDPVWPGRALQRFKDASNMTERLGALSALVESHSELAAGALQRLYDQFAGDPLVIDKWFMLQASASEREGRVFARVRELMQHRAFTLKNPNRVRSLISSLCLRNPGAFHRPDAAGYVFWAERVIELDALNPMIAARVARALDRWIHLAEPYRSAAREAIEVLQGTPELREVDLVDGRRKRGFRCPRCDTQLWGAPQRVPQLLNLHPGSLDETSWLEPVGHIWTRSAQPWVRIPADTLRYERQPEDVLPMVRAWKARSGKPPGV